MAHTTNSGFWSGGQIESTPLDGSEGHGARLRRSVFEPTHEPVHEEPEEIVVALVEEEEEPAKEEPVKIPSRKKN